MHTKAISRVLKLCNDMFDDNDKYHHRHHNTFLISEMKCSLDCVPNFEVDGIKFKISAGTFRNKISSLLKAGKIEVVYYSPQAFYTIKGVKPEMVMTGYYTGSSYLLLFTDISQMIQSIGLFRTSLLGEGHYTIYA
jgi:hypothetical protein